LIGAGGGEEKGGERIVVLLTLPDEDPYTTWIVKGEKKREKRKIIWGCYGIERNYDHTISSLNFGGKDSRRIVKSEG